MGKWLYDRERFSQILCHTSWIILLFWPFRRLNTALISISKGPWTLNLHSHKMILSDEVPQW